MFRIFKPTATSLPAVCWRMLDSSITRMDVSNGWFLPKEVFNFHFLCILSTAFDTCLARLVRGARAGAYKTQKNGAFFLLHNINNNTQFRFFWSPSCRFRFWWVALSLSRYVKLPTIACPSSKHRRFVDRQPLFTQCPALSLIGD